MHFLAVHTVSRSSIIMPPTSKLRSFVGNGMVHVVGQPQCCFFFQTMKARVLLREYALVNVITFLWLMILRDAPCAMELSVVQRGM